MEHLRISLVDASQYHDFIDGNPVQVRVILPAGQQVNPKKGDQVQVRYDGEQMAGKIIDEPLAITPAGEENREYSLEIVKAKEA